ncbi:MAG: phage tail protein [Tepidanaerobacter acetatoxydans]|mgnify:CR=1 FL=1|uniref:phage tail protein n=1 Tax=Tepidanaerobacter acetatoxydans TaxID=499229 RepID=UPI0026EF74F3|nr:phage tail protein [Tepidanaerobacter acetatoxydans]NLU09449.1 phage tail protein [Tepidanaerobacter acetatoxydans]
MAIGTLGPIVFNSSSEKIQTFEEYNHEKSARIATHDNLQNKPIVEFIGPGLDSITLRLTWSIEGNINPLTEIKKLEEKQEKGEVIMFFLAGKPVGNGKYLIENISRAQKRIDNKGNLLSISFDISMIEYPENARKETKIKTTTNTVKKSSTTKKTTTKKKYKYQNETIIKNNLILSKW